MYIIGLFVIVDPDSFDLVVPEIRSFCDIEIKSQNPESGILVVAIASDNEQQNKQLFDRIKSLPFVVETQIMYFYRYDEEEATHTSRAKNNDLVSKALQTYSSYNSIIHTRH
jgi:nitrate reductase NapAB chaperone NapD